MKGILSRIWQAWKTLGEILGNIVSGIILTVFYFTIFALVAVPYRLLGRQKKGGDSTFVTKEKTISTLEEFQTEA